MRLLGTRRTQRLHADSAISQRRSSTVMAKEKRRISAPPKGIVMPSRRSIAAVFAGTAVLVGAAGAAVGALHPVREVHGQPEAARGAGRLGQAPAAPSVPASAGTPAAAELPAAVALAEPARPLTGPEAAPAADSETAAADTPDAGSAAESAESVDAASSPQAPEAAETATSAETSTLAGAAGQEPGTTAETDE